MRTRIYPFVLILLLVPLGFTSGCALFSKESSPIASAETPEQKAFALYGTFVNLQETGAELILSPNVPEEVKAAIQATDAVAHPAAQILQSTAVKVLKARAELEAGVSTVEELSAVLIALDLAYREAGPKINALKLSIGSF